MTCGIAYWHAIMILHTDQTPEALVYDILPSRGRCRKAMLGVCTLTFSRIKIVILPLHILNDLSAFQVVIQHIVDDRI